MILGNIDAPPVVPPAATPGKIEPWRPAAIVAGMLAAATMAYWLLSDPQRLAAPNPRRRSALEREEEECEQATACYSPRRDRRGRRRRCAETFRSKAEAVDALDDATDGMLYRYLEQADDGSELLAELEEHTENRRGRRRRLRTWYDAAAWAAPSSRRWRDFDPGRLATISAALSAHLGEALPLELPRQTQQLIDADDQADDCKAAVRRPREPLEEAPF